MTKRRVTHDLSTFAGRLRAWLHFYLKDHQVIRMAWWNLEEIAPGVWRSNQPSPWRLRRYRAMGIRSVVSLRGGARQSFNLLEEAACDALGLSFHRVPGLAARRPRSGENLIAAADALAAIPQPFVMHCKSGADRTGLAATLYLTLVAGRPVAEVYREQLRPARIHFPRSRAGVISHIFRVYLRDAEPRGIAFRDWLLAGYDPDTVKADFKDWRRGAGRWAK